MGFLLYHEVGFQVCVRDSVHNLPSLLLLKLLDMILLLRYTFEGEFTYYVNNSVMSLGFSWTIMSLSTDVAKLFL